MGWEKSNESRWISIIMTLFNLIIVLSKKDKTKFIHDSNWYEIKIIRKKKLKMEKKKLSPCILSTS